MLRAGGVGGDVDVGRVPLSAVARRLCGGDHDLLARLVTGGDDYEVLCTIAPTAETAFVRDAQRAAIPVTRIGTVGTGSGARFVGPDGAPMALERLGWTHF